jgi:hypothetical protein
MFSLISSLSCVDRRWAGCNDGKSGDVIDIVRLSTGEDVKEAIKILILDFGLKNPSSMQVKGWFKKRVICEQSNAIQKGLDRKINDTLVVLKNIETEVMSSLLNIKAVDDLNRFGDLYHVLSQIEYWLDCLIECDPVVKIQTLEAISRFLIKIGLKAG